MTTIVPPQAGPTDLTQAAAAPAPMPAQTATDVTAANELPVPSGRSLGLPHPLGPRITLPPVVVAREPVLPVVAPDTVFSAMVAAAPWSGRSRAMRPVTRVRLTGRGHIAPARASSRRP